MARGAELFATPWTPIIVRNLLLGAQPHRVVLGHSGDSTDTDHLSTLAEFGFVLGIASDSPTEPPSRPAPTR
jgi:hypothetical protein